MYKFFFQRVTKICPLKIVYYALIFHEDRQQTGQQMNLAYNPPKKNETFKMMRHGTGTNVREVVVFYGGRILR